MSSIRGMPEQQFLWPLFGREINFENRVVLLQNFYLLAPGFKIQVLSAIRFRIPEYDAAVDVTMMHLECFDDAYFCRFSSNIAPPLHAKCAPSK